MAGGFNYAANKQIEVARLIQYGERVTNNQVATILKTEVNGDLSFNAGQVNFVLQPMDVVTITKKVGFTNPEVVSISGQVQNVGKYTLSTRVERVSEIVKRAGGLIGEAYGEGAYIKRSRYNIDTLKADESKTSIEDAYNRKFKAQKEAEKQRKETEQKEITAKGKDLRYLLFSWLEEVIFVLITEGFAIKRMELEIYENEGYKIIAKAYGEPLDFLKHNFKVEIKAPTFYEMKIEQKDGVFMRFLLDL